MLTGLLRYLLNILRERAGSLLGLVRKGLNAIRSLFGGARGLVGPLIKKALSFLLGKLSSAASSACSKVQGSLESLKRMAEKAMKGKPPEPETAANQPETTTEQQETASSVEAVTAERE